MSEGRRRRARALLAGRQLGGAAEPRRRRHDPVAICCYTPSGRASGRRSAFMPGCPVFSLILSIGLTILVNLIIRVF